MRKEIAIIGGGKVGTALGYLLGRRGFSITAVCCRALERAKASQAHTGGFATTDVVEAASSAQVVFISTKDDQIEEMCQAIAYGGGFRRGDVVLHFSGALSLDCLKAAREEGAFVGSVHPLQSFATVEDAIRNLPGSFFGVTASEVALVIAQSIVKALGGRSLEIKEEDKPLYHAAACIVSNYLVSLIHFGEEVASAIGFSEEQAREAFRPLIKGTLSNIANQGSLKSLTGPISRGDVGTLKMHLENLDAVSVEQRSLYAELGRYTARLALKKGSIDRYQYGVMEQLFLEHEAKRRKNCG